MYIILYVKGAFPKPIIFRLPKDSKKPNGKKHPQAKESNADKSQDLG